ncbi:ABC transporter substrate-binding protein [Salinisphaera sp. RV14]|uniref:ABC transporter substrate-binding protein n=1 Tax=unclassified Salinisphaera TaxID=2649847 RepID=UPI003F8298C9
MTPIRSALLAAAAGLALSVGAAAPALADSGKPYIAIVSKGFSQQYWQAVKHGAEQEAQKKGARITFEGPPTESDVAIQMNQLSAVLNKHPDAIGFAALDSQAAAPMMMQAKSQGIPVIAFDSGVKSNVPVSTVATNNKAAGAEAARHMAKLLHDKGTVGLIIHDQTSVSGTDRRDGFMNWMKKNAPNIKMLRPQYSNSDMSKAADITKAILSSHPHLDGMFASNEASAEGMALGLKESGRKNIVAIGFDSGKAQIDAIKNGVLTGSITQNPVGMGRDMVDTALKVIHGKSVPKTIDTGFYWYDKSNMDQPKIQKNLYQ